MKKKNNLTVKIISFLALFGIVAGIVWTGILVLFGGWYENPVNQELSQEQIQELIDAYESQSWAIDITQESENETE